MDGPNLKRYFVPPPWKILDRAEQTQVDAPVPLRTSQSLGGVALGLV